MHVQALSMNRAPMDFEAAQDVVNTCYKSLRQVSQFQQRFLEDSSMMEALFEPTSNVSACLIQLGKFLLDNLSLTIRDVTDREDVETESEREWLISTTLLIITNASWSSLSASYKCMEKLSVMTIGMKRTWLNTTVSGSATSLEPLRVCFDGFELFRTICEDMMERIKNLLRKLNRKTIGEYSMKEIYNRKLNQLEASLTELKTESEQPVKRVRPGASNFVTGGQQIIGAMTNTILQTSDVKKKEVQL